MDYISRTEKQKIWDQLTEKRRIHTEGVLECALAMAERFGADADKAEVAVICHDVYRGRDDETLNALIDEFGIEERYKNFDKRKICIDENPILRRITYIVMPIWELDKLAEEFQKKL